MSGALLANDQKHISQYIEQLLQFFIKQQLLHESDVDFTRNLLLHLFKCDEPSYSTEDISIDNIDETVEKLLDYGYKIGLIEHNTTTYRDLFDAQIMGLLMPRPSQFIDTFNRLYNERGAQAATQYFYNLSVNSRYIRLDRVRQNPTWLHQSEYGPLQITINLSKPEKDPVEIAKLKEMPQSHYPLCLLCKENVGYAGRLNHPARQHLRILPTMLQDEQWFLQYSPYVYYNEHSIVFKSAHTDMKITRQTFARLLDFLEQFPHYFIGSNADLPIVGGSILNHDHYQAGRHAFPMDDAPIIESYLSSQFPAVKLAIVKWPLSVIRLQSATKSQLIEAASYIHDHWREYSDASQAIHAYSLLESGEKLPHNTITPIARIKQNNIFELDLVLRNNRTTTKHPFGIFHPHEHLHHIKKENIGLIEVMGLAVLPARLKNELHLIAQLLAAGDENQIEATKEESHPLAQHSTWINELFVKYGKMASEANASNIVYDEVGSKFLEVLEHAGVYKQTKAGLAAFRQFIERLNFYAQ